jgi:hypothetical protein
MKHRLADDSSDVHRRTALSENVPTSAPEAGRPEDQELPVPE